MKDFSPPRDNEFDSIVDDSESVIAANESEGEDLTMIYHRWGDLHHNTRRNLLRFEDPSFELKESAEGDAAVRNLVSGDRTRLLITDLTQFYSLTSSMISFGFAFVSTSGSPLIR